MGINIKKLPKSELEIESEVSAEDFESNFKEALETLGGDLEVDGFRKGHVPEDIKIKNIPEIKILEEMAQRAISKEYPKILEAEKIDAIGRPEITITKMARKNPLGFKIKTAVLPKMVLPDYKKTAHEVNENNQKESSEIKVEDKEVEDTIMQIRKSRAMAKKANKEPKPEKEAGKDQKDKGNKEPKLELPEFDNEFVKSLGPFENVKDFKKKLKENIKLEKQNMAKEKNRLKIVEEILKKSEIEVPEILINAEVDKIIYRMKSDIANMGLKFEDYLKNINKKEEELKEEFKGEGEKKAQLSLILYEIAKKENLKADPGEIEKEVKLILEHYKDADPARARMHAENVLTNEKIFQFLESQ